MATPIKPTPHLKGKDAKRFIEMLNTPFRISDEEKERAKKAYLIVKSISNFPL